MAPLAHAFKIVWVIEQDQVALVWFLMVHHGRARRLPSLDNEHIAPLALILITPDDGLTQGLPRRAVV